MAERTNDFAALRPEERARLDRFATAFDRVDASTYPMFTELIITDEMRAAQERAIQLLGDGPRKRAVQAAVEAFIDAGTRAYSDRISLPDTFLLYQARPDRAEDRVRFLATIDRAVVALILWDELDEDDRALLLGPWGTFVEALG